MILLLVPSYMKNLPHNRGQSYGYGGQYFDVYGGIDLRYYKGKHYNEIVDLYGGKYFIDDSRMNANSLEF